MVSVYLAGVSLLLTAFIAGCAPNTLGEIRAAEPLRTGVYQREAQSLADCAKRRIETEPWRFGQPTVQLSQEADHVAVNALFFRSMLFEVTFRPQKPDVTEVQYRRGYDGHGTEDQTWAIIEACAQRS